MEQAANIAGAAYYKKEKPANTYTFHEGFKQGAQWQASQQSSGEVSLLQKALDYLHNNVTASIVYEDFHDFSKGIKGAEVDYFPETATELLSELGIEASLHTQQDNSGEDNSAYNSDSNTLHD